MPFRCGWKCSGRTVLRLNNISTTNVTSSSLAKTVTTRATSPIRALHLAIIGRTLHLLARSPFGWCRVKAYQAAETKMMSGGRFSEAVPREGRERKVSLPKFSTADDTAMDVTLGAANTGG